MKNNNPTLGFVSGKATPAIKQLCQELAQQGVSVLLTTKNDAGAEEEHEQVRQLTGQPGQDLFFNGWKLLF